MVAKLQGDKSAPQSCMERHRAPRPSVERRFQRLSAGFDLFDFFFFKRRLGCLSAGFACLSAGFGDLSAGFCRTIRTRWIGANPEKSDLVNFRAPDKRKFSELCVLLFFLGKIDKMVPKSRFSKRIFGESAGSTKLDRPHCKQF